MLYLLIRSWSNDHIILHKLYVSPFKPPNQQYYHSWLKKRKTILSLVFNKYILLLLMIILLSVNKTLSYVIMFTSKCLGHSPHDQYFHIQTIYKKYINFTFHLKYFIYYFILFIILFNSVGMDNAWYMQDLGFELGHHKKKLNFNY